MAAMVCPFCKVLVNFSFGEASDLPPHIALTYPSGRGHRYRRATCSNNRCKMEVFLVSDNRGEIVKAWPEHVGGKAFPDVPDQIASAANEAHMCLSIGAYRASVAMARAVVEATAKDHEITKGNLQVKIEELAKRDIISTAMKDAAEEVRFAGNEVAHGDLAEEPLDKEDAEEILGLMDAIVLRVYQEPKQVERVRERRTARKRAV